MPPPELLNFLGQAASATGLSGVLWFLLLEMRRELRAIAAAQNRQTRAQLLLTLAINGIGMRATEQARTLLEEVTAAEKEAATKERTRHD